MMQLTEELTTTENKVAFARQAYQRLGDGATTTSARCSRPACWPACSISRPAALLEIPADKQAEVREAPKVAVLSAFPSWEMLRWLRKWPPIFRRLRDDAMNFFEHQAKARSSSTPHGAAVRAGGGRDRAGGGPGGAAVAGNAAGKRRWRGWIAVCQHARHGRGDRTGFDVPHGFAARRWRIGRVADGRHCGAGEHQRLPVASPAQRGRGNRHRLRRAGAEALRDGARGRHQCFRRGLFAFGCRRGRDPRRAGKAQSR